MGLLYAFPVSLEETDFAKLEDKTLTLKTYGLPYLFWGYAAAIFVVVAFMFLAVKAPVLKLVELGDETDAMLGYSLLSFLGFVPVALLGFFFFEKRIIRSVGKVSLEYRIFGLRVFSEKFTPEANKPFSIESFLSSPNVARMKASEESAGFQNKGYFILWLHTDKGTKISLDRHSRKADLVKLEELLKLVP